MSVAVEEFFNRVHNTNDGRFGTSGTGGGHYAGRAKGAKRPALKSGKAAPAAKSAVAVKDKPKAAAPKRDINAEAKAHVASLVAKHSADRAARKAANKDKPAAPKREEGGDTAKLNEIAKLKQHLKDNPAPTHKPASKAAEAGPKPAQNKQDAGQKAPAPKKVKVPLSDRIKKFGKFAKKLGDAVVKDNMTTSEYNQYRKSHDPSFKGERLTLRNTLLTHRQQR